MMRCCISVQKRVAITLWCLATPAEYRTVGYLFGVSQSSVCEIVRETCTAIVTVLLTTYIKFPTGNDIDTVVREFKVKWEVPSVLVPLMEPIYLYLCPVTTALNIKMGKAGTLCLFKANYRFLDICVGWPGSVHDARVFVNSNLYLKNYTSEQISSVDVPLYMIGDSAYPM